MIMKNKTDVDINRDNTHQNYLTKITRKNHSFIRISSQRPFVALFLQSKLKHGHPPEIIQLAEPTNRH